MHSCMHQLPLTYIQGHVVPAAIQRPHEVEEVAVVAVLTTPLFRIDVKPLMLSVVVRVKQERLTTTTVLGVDEEAGMRVAALLATYEIHTA